MPQIYPISLIEAATCSLGACKTQDARHSLRPFLPYCIKRLDGAVIPLNRDYKPIGIITKEYLEYESCGFLMIPLELVHLDFNDHNTPTQPHPEKRWNEEGYFWFWSDANAPYWKKNAFAYIRQVHKVFRINLGYWNAD